MRLGIRLQLLLAIGSLLVLALVPLYVATTQLTHATMAVARESAARALGRATAAHVLAASAWSAPDVVQPVLEAQVGEGGLEAVALYEGDGERSVVAGDAEALAVLPATLTEPVEASRAVRVGDRRALLVIVPAPGDRGGGAVAVVSLAGDLSRGAALPRIVGLYTGIVALALLVFAYIVLTRLVVRPVVNLSDAARRVAAGARALDVPRAGAAELVDLGSSVAAMATRLRADEERVRTHAAELATKNQELGQKNDELVRAQEQLVRSERLASVGRLAAGMAHEIGNPLAAILGLQELLAAGDLPEEEQKDFLARMRKETERIHRVLRDLLDFARPDAPASERAHVGSAERAIDDVLALLAPQKELRDVTLVREVAEGLPAVAMGEARLQQIVLNLVLNAAGVVKQPGGRITVRARPEGERVRIEVEDDGPGIAPSVRTKLFEPFVTTKAPGEGTGLGLAVCRGLVEAAGGTIVAEDPEAGGARFVVLVPRARAGAEELGAELA